MRRRQLLALAGAAGAAAACGRWPWEGPPAGATDDLDALAAALVDGGQSLDGIPAIDLPDYDVAGETRLPRRSFFTPHVGSAEDGDVVDAFVGPDGRPRAYPRYITVWHEIVNDVIAGQPVSVTYCPLTGSTLLFSGRLADGESTLGVSGWILNSNLVMFDRASVSFWPQLLGVAIQGPRKGERLRTLPSPVTTTLGRWRTRYPNTLVLSTLTGALRPYRSWPYGDDYDRNATIMFPLSATDDRLAPKRVVYGVRTEAGAAAIAKDAALANAVTLFQIGGSPHVAIGDAELGVIRVYRAAARGRALHLRPHPAGAVDEETGSVWSYMGIAIDGPLVTDRLEQIPAPEVFWFAWYAFFPTTSLIA